MKTLLLPIALFSISFQVFALVDYSDPQPEAGRMQKNLTKTQTRIENNGSNRSDFSFSSNYEISQLKTEKVGTMNFDLHIQSPYNVFLDGSFWQANYKGKSQAGNPKIILGFNWLKIGNASDEARLDLLAGMRLPGQSELATSRTDKIFGVETTKRFMNFGLGLGYDLTLAGDTKKQDETSIGNIHRFSVSAGWMVSNDIQFELEAENFKVNPAADQTRSNRLIAPASFSTLSPKMNLGIASFVNFVLGARFQMQKSPLDAKVFDLHGANSNSIFTGLNFNI
jgi:hypothetical protein